MRQQCACAFLDLDRPLDEQEFSAVGELMEVMGSRLELGHRPDEQVLIGGWVELGRNQAGQAGVVRFADVMAVEVFQFLEVEPRGRFAGGYFGNSSAAPIHARIARPATAVPRARQ